VPQILTYQQSSESIRFRVFFGPTSDERLPLIVSFVDQHRPGIAGERPQRSEAAQMRSPVFVSHGTSCFGSRYCGNVRA